MKRLPSLLLHHSPSPVSEQRTTTLATTSQYLDGTDNGGRTSADAKQRDRQRQEEEVGACGSKA